MNARFKDIPIIQQHLGLSYKSNSKSKNEPALLTELSKISDTELSNMESRLKSNQKITFSEIFNDPVGQTLLTHFLDLKEPHNSDYIKLLNDIKIFQQLSTQKARINAAFTLLKQFYLDIKQKQQNSNNNTKVYMKHFAILKNKITICDVGEDNHEHDLACCHKYYCNTNINANLFDEMMNDLINDLESNGFVQFCNSQYYQDWLKYQCMKLKYNSNSKIKQEPTDFMYWSKLGSSKFGMIYACEKKDCSKLYAIKLMDKKRIFNVKALDNILSRHSLLMDIDCEFILRLNYTFMDYKNFYFVCDLAIGEHLKSALTLSRVFFLLYT